jgi:hypothetical protein
MLPDRLTARPYLDFLGTALSGLPENVALSARAKLWLQHDGAPGHYGDDFPAIVERIMSRKANWTSRAVAWPSRSPDLTPMDFSLWRHP